MPSYKDEAYPVEHLREYMAALPLPNPTVVIDVRADITQPHALVWDLATEIDDLTKEMYLQQVPRWRFLANGIDFLRINPLPPDRSLIETPHFDIMKRNEETQSFTKKEMLADFVGREYVDRVRNLRIQATQDMGDEKGSTSTGSTADPAYATVHIFFLVDLLNEASLRSAASYASLLKKRDRELESIGRAKRVIIDAICLNADPQYRQLLYEAQDPTMSASNDVFEMIILIQSYRDDEAYIGREAQANEMELILYMLLLAPPRELSEGSRLTNEQEIQQNILKMSGQEITPSPCPIYLLGISSVEYSGRWGTRYLNYGLARKVLQIMQDSTDIEQGDLLLQRPDNNQDWLDQWWSSLERVAAKAPAPFIPERELLDTFQQRLEVNPFEDRSTLTNTHTLFESYQQSIHQYYKEITNTIRAVSEEQDIQATALIRLARERTTRKGQYTQSETAEEILCILEDAEHFLVTMYRGPAGALPRALDQLSELALRISNIERLTWKPLDLLKYSSQFEAETSRVQRTLARTFQTWQLPIVGSVLRSSVFVVLAFVIIGIILFFTLTRVSITPSIFTHPLFAGVSLFFIFLVGVLVAVLLLVLQALRRRLRYRREQATNMIRAVAQKHLQEMRAAFSARLGIIILEQSGIYKPGGEMCRYVQHLRDLDKQFNVARENALMQQQRAYERLYLTLSNDQIGMAKEIPWMVLNSRKDVLPWKQIVQTLQDVSKRLVEQDEFFHALARELIFLISSQNQLADRTLSALEQGAAGKDNIWQLHMLGTELVAVMVLANTLGYNLDYVQSLIDRYLDLQVESAEAEELSVLTEPIIALQDRLKDAMLEQTLRDNIDSRYQRQLFYLAKSSKSEPVEEKLGTWIEFQYLQDARTRRLLRSIGITARLREFRMKPATVLEDLENRCKLLGYREQTQIDDIEHFYFLFVPEPGDKEFAEVLDSSHAVHIQRLSFPDREKLIYVQVHRMYPGVPTQFLITNSR